MTQKRMCPLCRTQRSPFSSLEKSLWLSLSASTTSLSLAMAPGSSLSSPVATA
ncbi:unnamed protein product [Coregonus sp. 'balchen']|nr:unnamed protein product [Coregonus sp. 'balchen']